ncbi:MAG TPA: DICT sensory domain-containing protein [Trebonia sp.]|nr:DICT sensory domain-containing protein [Trebonia sp.]
MTEPESGLAIGELAERTAVPAATLRSWETRYGFPRPRRLDGGHRRYDEGDVELIREVLRQRGAGLSLEAAIGRATARGTESESSVFAGLRRRQPDLQPQVVRKSTLLALTRAMEDEYCARAERAVLFASFQRQRYYRASRDRWAELSRTALVTTVFADFAEPPAPGAALLEVPVPAGAPLRREWTLVCEARDYPACLTAWEFPGQQGVPDADRRFEALWALNPRAVRDAATICAQLAEQFAPGLGLLDRLPDGPPPPGSADLQHATGLLGRMISYLDAAARP